MPGLSVFPFCVTVVHLFVLFRSSDSLENFALFETPSFDFVYNTAHYSDPNSTVVDKIVLQGAYTGERAYLKFFNIFALNDKASNIQLEFESDLVRKKKHYFERTSVIPLSKTTVDLKVVKVWMQAGVRLHKKDPDLLVPELLLPNDLQELRGGWVEELNFVPGVNGNGILFDETVSIYRENLTSFFHYDSGGVEFNVKPVGWDGSDVLDHNMYFFTQLADSEVNPHAYMYIYAHQNGNFYAVYRDGINWCACSLKNADVFTKDQFIRVTFTFNTATRNLKLYVDGNLLCDDIEDAFVPMTDVPRRLVIGSQGNEKTDCSCVLDEIKIFNVQPLDSEVQSGNYLASKISQSFSLESSQSLENDGFVHFPTTYYPPDVDETNIVTTQIPAETTKQFFIKIMPPKDADSKLVPGKYVSKIVVTFLDTGEVEKIPVELTLHPIELLETDKMHMLYHSISITGDNEESARIYLQDMVDHGINGLSVSGGGGVSGVNSTLSVLKDFPQLQNVILSLSLSDPKGEIDEFKRHGYEPYVYGVDECNSGERIAQQLVKSKKIHDGGGMVVTAILFQNAEQYEDPKSSFYNEHFNASHTFKELGYNEPLDWRNYHTTYTDSDPMSQDVPVYQHAIKLFNGTKEKRGDIRETYYWQAWCQKYKFSRAMAGVFLHWSQFDGNYFFHYTDRFDYEGLGDPFDDFDGDTVYKDLNIVYRSKTGVISTMQWEAVATGYTDYQYIHTFEEFLKKYQHLMDKNEFGRRLKWIQQDAMLPFLQLNTIHERSGRQFDDLRQAIVQEYLYLKKNYVDRAHFLSIFLPIAIPSAIALCVFLAVVCVLILLCAFVGVRKKVVKNNEGGKEEMDEDEPDLYHERMMEFHLDGTPL